MAAKPAWLPGILKEQSFQHFHAFFDSFKHNHKAHSIIAYARMGASLDRVKHHCEQQNARSGVVPYNKNEPLTQKTEADGLKSDNMEDYRGANEAYYKVLDYFTKLYETKYGKDMKKMIAAEFPSMGDGPLVAAFHSVIHTGYGYVADSETVVLEGLALTYSQYSPFEPKDATKLTDSSNFGKGTRDMLDVLNEIRESKEMLENINKLADTEEHRQKSPGNLLDWYCMSIIENYSDHFLQLTDSIKLPDFFDPSQESMEQLVRLVQWIEDMTATVYVKSEFVNQFFLLHGLTGSWSLRQIIDLFTYKEALPLVRTTITSYLMVYASTGGPKFTKSADDYWKGDKIDQEAWNVILKDVMAQDFEDHVAKVVQILYEKWHADQSSENSKLYIAGARMAIDNNYNHSPFPIIFPNVLPK